jgi:3',5'-cyclic AMP phosphodiesterase CpdA
VIGNHDYYGDPGRNFRALFPYPYADPRAAYWSFDLAGAHFVMVDCFERDGHLSGAQKTWIEADLRAAASRGSRYRFLFLHLTPITTGTSETAGELERWLLPLADRTGVDAVFFGHDHHYEHWEVVYGNQGLVFDPGDRPAGQPIHYFCSGGGGAYLEIDYGLLTRKPSTFERRLYDRRAGQWVKRTYARLPWDSERFIDHTDDPEYGQLLDGKHYYHLPEEASYQGDADWLGYRYGEQTLHYLLIEIGPEEAVISAHYPSGELLTGPRGDLPQRFSIPARR